MTERGDIETGTGEVDNDGSGVAVGPGREPPAEAPSSPSARPSDGADASGLTSADYSVAFSPRNVAIGLAILAGIVALAARRHRRDDGGDPEGR